MPPDLTFEETLWSQGFEAVAGVDEAGRGPLAGPVVAAAVVFPVGPVPVEGLDDSKKLSPARREALFGEIQARAAWAIAEVSAQQIDEINILRAALEAMRLAVEKLPAPADFLLIDGNKEVPHKTPQRAVVKGDSLSCSIAAASILAKVHRDRLMRTLHEQYPHYGFAEHKGYPTRAHREALKRHGPCPIHRRTFRGVKELL